MARSDDVIATLQAKFSRPEKDAARDFVADYFRAVGARVVGDLWGGGSSAVALRDAIPGVQVISAENGSVCEADWFLVNGEKVTRAELRDAAESHARANGYRLHLGDVREIGEVDAIWLDFCAQWHPEMARILDSLTGTPHIAISIMPERDGLGTLGLEDRLLALAAVVSAHTEAVPAFIGSYRRNSFNQDMALIILDRRDRADVGDQPASLMPVQVRESLLKHGTWASRRFRRRGSLVLGKCVLCDGSFTWRQGEGHSAGVIRRRCPRCQRPKSYYVPVLVRHPRACRACGSPLAPAYGRRVFCSPQCAGELPKELAAGTHRTCVFCRASFVGKANQKFCSRRCNWNASDARAAAARPPKACEVCGTEFRRSRGGPRKFCSTKCRWRAYYVPVAYDRQCAHCQQDFLGRVRDQLYCSDHCQRKAWAIRRKSR